VSIWTFLGYILIFATIMLAVVGGMQVLRRLEAQQRLRRELTRMQSEAPPATPSDATPSEAPPAAPPDKEDPDATPDADNPGVTGPAQGD
jgi:hypothetical protein